MNELDIEKPIEKLLERNPNLKKEQIELSKRALRAWSILRRTGLYKNKHGQDDPKILARKLGFRAEHCHKIINGFLPAGKSIVQKLELIAKDSEKLVSGSDEQRFREQWAQLGESVIQLAPPARQFVIESIDLTTQTAARLVRFVRESTQGT